MKIFLHVSKDEQKKDFSTELMNRKKNWKFSAGDLPERALFDQYMEAYETAINETSKDYAPGMCFLQTVNGLQRVAAIQIIIDTLEK